ncbi:Transmembrane secretion effector [Fragilaria crotonensis]|nr:Transmembrane secretion effector [Fragilaria crotonensis]
MAHLRCNYIHDRSSACRRQRVVSNRNFLPGGNSTHASVILRAPGGVLADSRDRRQSMIALNLLASAVTLLNLIIWYSKSISMVYLVAMLSQVVQALYEPCRGALMPLLLSDEEEIKLTTTLTGLAKYLTAALGASLGGLIASCFGARVCFILDSLTYLTSACILYQVKGDWHVVDIGATKYSSIWHQMVGMTIEGYKYVRRKFWGSLILMKASVALIYGAADALNVSFAERGGGDSSVKLGILFGMTGIGCLVGLLLSDCFTTMSDIKSLQLASIVSIGFGTLGCLGVGLLPSFEFNCIFSMLRSGGFSATWINSSVLLQTFSAPAKLGRVFAVDNALALFAQSLSALLCGFLQDHVGLSPEQVTLMMAATGGVMVSAWGIYHIMGYGAADEEAKVLVVRQRDTKLEEQEPQLSEESPLLRN